MFAVIVTALTMGFGASFYCMAFCIPVVVPFAAAGGKPGISSGLSTGLLFCMGRLIAYSLLAAVFVSLKTIIDIHSGIIMVATLLCGIVLMLSGLSLLGVIKQENRFGHILCRYIAGSRSPLYLGMMTGLRPCGPLLAAMALLITLDNIPEMVMFLGAFWLASSVLVIVLGVTGGKLASLFQKRLGIERLKGIIGVAMLVIGFYFLMQATIQLL